MTTSNTAQTQRAKMAMVPVLAITLVAILFWPAEKEPDISSNAVATLPARQTVVATPPAEAAELWQVVNLAAATEINPFLKVKQPAPSESAPVPGGAGEATVAGDARQGTENASNLASPPERRATRSVQAVVTRNGMPYACIDGEVAAVGDVLRDGTRVLSITADAVIVEFTR